MPRLLRPILTFLAGALFLGVCVLWARSYRRADVVAFFDSNAHLHAGGSYSGLLILFFSDVPFDPAQRYSFETSSVPADQLEDLETLLFDKPATKLSFAGFKLAIGNLALFATPPPYTALTVPHWFVALLTGAPALLWLRRAVRRRRWTRAGRCGHCGYDLRGNDTGRCPECGEPAHPAAPAVAAAVLVALLLSIPVAPRAVAQQEELPVLRDLDLKDLTFEKAIDRLREASGANIVVDWKSVEAAGMDRNTPVSLRVWDVRLDVAIELLFVRAGGNPDDPLWTHDNGIITISSLKGHRRLTTKVFDVRPMIRAMRRAATEQRGNEPEWTEAEQELVGIISDTIDPDTWRDAGGSQGSLSITGGKLVVVQTPGALQEVEKLLVDQLAWLTEPGPLPKPPPPRPPEPPPAPSPLQTVKIRELDLANVPLEQALERLRSQTGANIVVNWMAIESAGIERAKPVILRLRDVSLGAAIDAILVTAGGVVKFRVDELGGVVTVSVAEDVRPGPARFYDVRDVVRALDAKRAKEPPHEGAADKPDNGTEELILLITRNVQPDTWREAGGAVGMIRSFFGRLIVVQTPEAHGEIEHMLAEMRRAVADDGKADDKAKPPATSPPAPSPPAPPPAGGSPRSAPG